MTNSKSRKCGNFSLSLGYLLKELEQREIEGGVTVGFIDKLMSPDSVSVPVAYCKLGGVQGVQATICDVAHSVTVKLQSPAPIMILFSFHVLSPFV